MQKAQLKFHPLLTLKQQGEGGGFPCAQPLSSGLQQKMSGCGTGAAPPPPLIEMLVHVKPWAGQAAKKPTSPPAGEPWPDFFLCRNNL